MGHPYPPPPLPTGRDSFFVQFGSHAAAAPQKTQIEHVLAAVVHQDGDPMKTSALGGSDVGARMNSVPIVEPGMLMPSPVDNVVEPVVRNVALAVGWAAVESMRARTGGGGGGPSRSTGCASASRLVTLA